jgi:hypothetical protein
VELHQIAQLKSLSILNISNNLITQLPQELSELENLSSLHASNNKLSSKEDISVLKDCVNLTVVDLHHNLLQDTECVTEVIWKMPALAVITLHHNACIQKVVQYRRSTIHAIPTLTYLDDRPVSDGERKACEAWAIGGLEAEHEERERQREQEKAEQKRNFEALAALQAENRAKRLAQGDNVTDEPNFASPSLKKFHDDMVHKIDSDEENDEENTKSSDNESGSEEVIEDSDMPSLETPVIETTASNCLYPAMEMGEVASDRILEDVSEDTPPVRVMREMDVAGKLKVPEVALPDQLCEESTQKSDNVTEPASKKPEPPKEASSEPSIAQPSVRKPFFEEVDETPSTPFIRDTETDLKPKIEEIKTDEAVEGVRSLDTSPKLEYLEFNQEQVPDIKLPLNEDCPTFSQQTAELPKVLIEELPLKTFPEEIESIVPTNDVIEAEPTIAKDNATLRDSISNMAELEPESNLEDVSVTQTLQNVVLPSPYTDDFFANIPSTEPPSSSVPEKTHDQEAIPLVSPIPMKRTRKPFNLKIDVTDLNSDRSEFPRAPHSTPVSEVFAENDSPIALTRAALCANAAKSLVGDLGPAANNPAGIRGRSHKSYHLTRSRSSTPDSEGSSCFASGKATPIQYQEGPPAPCSTPIAATFNDNGFLRCDTPGKPSSTSLLRRAVASGYEMGPPPPPPVSTPITPTFPKDPDHTEGLKSTIGAAGEPDHSDTSDKETFFDCTDDEVPALAITESEPRQPSSTSRLAWE